MLYNQNCFSNNDYGFQINCAYDFDKNLRIGVHFYSVIKRLQPT
jgi:hypothetical protein